MPVISIASSDALVEKLKSNRKEVAAPGGERFHAGLSANSFPFKGRVGVGMGYTRRRESPFSPHPGLPLEGGGAVVPRGAGERHGRGQAAEPGEERDGGMMLGGESATAAIAQNGGARVAQAMQHPGGRCCERRNCPSKTSVGRKISVSDRPQVGFQSRNIRSNSIPNNSLVSFPARRRTVCDGSGARQR